MACNGLKKGSFHWFVTPNGVESFLEKHIFDPFLVANWPICKAFWGQNYLGSKWDHFTPFEHHNWT